VIARQDKFMIEGSVLGPEALALRLYSDDNDDRLLLMNLGRDLDMVPLSDPLFAAPGDRAWKVLWSSEDPRYGGIGTRPYDNKRWHVSGQAAVLFEATEPKD
jgi:maltooligosyltrehalose trehalohydrolase